ncbi:hypothetical protein RB653_008410 [Dictyostelium firmibasis]|uniref:Heme O synthase n=1 Tax=Dictyostelium firmibasis TaxID=79012 RepID=A0AAN7YWK6_9MYCE
MLSKIIKNISKSGVTSAIKSKNGGCLYFQNYYMKSSSSITRLNSGSNNNHTNIILNNKILNKQQNDNKIIYNNIFEEKNQYLKRIYSTTSTHTSNTTATDINSTTVNDNNEKNSTEQNQSTTTKQPQKPKGFLRGPYMTLIKLPITVYVTLTAIAGYVAACPIGAFDWVVLSQVSIGTFLASCSANIHNQDMEVQHDRKMPRTKDRPLVVGTINRGKAWAGSMALLTLGFGTMAITPSLFIPGTLAACNVLLYCWYTDLKRVTPLNTWIGAFVGAIPPLIGSVAATGQFESIGMLLATFMYIWQIPHFLALSQVLREQYRGAGYKMLSVTHEKQTVDRVSLAHALFGIPLPFLFDHFFNFNVHPITLTCMALSSASLALPFITKISPKRLYIISLISLPITLFLSCFLRQPYAYYDDDEEDEKKDENNKIKEIEK